MPLLSLPVLSYESALRVWITVDHTMITSQYFLLSRQLGIVFVYYCQIHGQSFSPFSILWYKYEAKYGKIPQYFFECSDNLKG